LKKKHKKLIYFIAGEPSGDLHASNLLLQLKKLDDNLIFRGLGGPLMEAQGLFPIDDFKKLSVMGFFEVLRDLPFFIKLKKKVINDIKNHSPATLVLVDYPGFNLKIAKAIKNKIRNINIVYYISPQIWAWKEKRINIIKKHIDSLIVLFPFEVAWYKNRGVNVQYFGHPLIDLYKSHASEVGFKKNKVIGLFPGSRSQEIVKHVPVLKECINLLKNRFKNIHFLVGLAEGTNKDVVLDLGLKTNFTIIKNNSLKAFNLSDVAIVASGTATLECAITKTPCVVIYKTSILSWLIASLFMKIQFVSIVNILANKMVYKELLQKKCTPQLIYKNVLNLLENKDCGKIKELEDLSGSLGEGTAYLNTAKYIL